MPVSEVHAALVPVDTARRMLAEAKGLDAIKDIRDKAEAMRLYAKEAKLGLEAQNHAAEIKIRAERRAGELLRESELAKGRPEKMSQATTFFGPVEPAPVKLSELGITRDQSSRWQQIASLPEETFEQHIAESKAAGRELTTAAALQIAKERERKEVKSAAIAEIEAKPPLPEGPFEVICVDPPWRYDKRAEDATHRARLPYPDMLPEEIAALDIGGFLAESGIVWLWTTNAFMGDAHEIARVWGLQVKTILTWAKDRMGTGDWLRGQTEHALLCVRGRPLVKLTNQTTLLHGALREHSRKPDEFYELVRQLCPGRRLEMFARESRPGFVAWGAERDLFS